VFKRRRRPVEEGEKAEEGKAAPEVAPGP